MASDALYLALAEALGRPSKRYRAAQEGLGAIEKAAEGYVRGKEIQDTFRKRKMQNQTLSEALGGVVPERISSYSSLPVQTTKDLGGLDALAKLTEPGKTDDWMAKFKMREDAINKRQKDRQDFVRGMIGEKGNKDAINQAKNAVQGLGYVDDLWAEMDRLDPTQKALAANDLTGKLYPTINTLKKNVRRTAGFSEGGKNLTANELEIVVDSFEPTMLDDQKSRVLKKKIARDFYSGTIDLYEAGRLLGPAGSKLLDLAEKQNQRNSMRESLIQKEMVGGGDDVNSLFDSVGVEE